MSVRVSTWAWKQPVRGNSKLVLLALADQANDLGSCYPGQRTLAEKCGISMRALQDHLVRLEEAGYITRERRCRNDGKRTSDLYTLHLPADLAGSPFHHPQISRDLPAKNVRTKAQKLRVVKDEPSGEPSGEPGSRRKFPRFEKAQQR